MTDDLVKRLRKGPLRDDYETAVTMSEAADYIEKLEAALRGVIAIADRDCPEFRFARKALDAK